MKNEHFPSVLKAVVIIFTLLTAAVQVEASVNMTPTWTYQSPPQGASGTWIGDNISLGNSGNESFTSLGGFSPQMANRVFSAYDLNNATPVMEHMPNSGNGVFSTKPTVASAKDTNIHAAFRYYKNNPSSNIYVPTIKRYSSSGGIIWSYDFPFQVNGSPSTPGYLEISEDGQKIIGAVYNFSTGKIEIATLLGNSNIPVSYVQFGNYASPSNISFSSDLNRAYIRTFSRNYIINTQNGQIFHENLNFDTFFGASDISGDGSVFAESTTNLSTGLTKIKAYKWNGQSYVLNFSYDLAEPIQCGHLALSDDGSFMAAGCYISTNPVLQTKIYGFDLESGSLVLSDQSTGIGQLNNMPTDVDVSDDGEAFAVALSGDESGQQPVLRVYTKTNGWNLYGTFNHPDSLCNSTVCSAMKINIEAEKGRGTLALASKGSHLEEFAGEGFINMFNINTPLNLNGVPYQNQEVDFEFEAQAGTVLLSTGLAPTPNLIPGIGWLYLDPSNLIILPPAQADQNGVVTIPYTFTQSPGSVLYVQALNLSPNRRFQDYYKKVNVY